MSAPKLSIAWRLLKKKLGFRMLMDLIPLDATLVKGSHGIRPASTKDHPLLIAQKPGLIRASTCQPTELYELVMA